MYINRNHLWKLVTFILLIIIFSCRSLKLVDKKSNLLKLTNILKEYRNKNQIKSKNIDLKGKIQLLIKGKDYNFNTKIRIEKGEKIWISASFLGFEVARALIQPHQTEAYEKLQKTFLKGNFSLIGKYLKTNFLNYSQLENILLGRSLFQEKNKDYIFSMNKNTYQLYSIFPIFTTNIIDKIKKYNDKIEIDRFFHLKKEIIECSDGEKISIQFGNWENINNEYFPTRVCIFVNNQIHPILSIKFQEIKTNGSMLDISFSIPKGYTERQL